MSDNLQVRDVLDALQNVDPTFPVTVKIWTEDEEGEYEEKATLIRIGKRSLDIVFEVK